MSNLLETAALGLLVTLCGCATSNPHLNLELQDDSVRLSVSDAGISVLQFLKVGQRVTGKTFRLGKSDDGRIHFVGTIKVAVAKFPDFMRTTLRSHGYEWRTEGQGDSEITHVARIKKLAEAASESEVIKLEHADCKELLASLKKLAKSDRSSPKLVVVAHAASNAILLSGTRDQVAAAKDVIARLDRKVK
jgi:type II secretory pathway component GspD/PulD (secretin)